MSEITLESITWHFFTHNMNSPALVCLVGMTSIALLSCSRTTHTVNGQIVIEAPQVEIPGRRVSGTPCSGAEYVSRLGVGNLTPGAQITIKDDQGKIVALGSIQEGKFAPVTSEAKIAEFRANLPNVTTSPLNCHLPFSIEGVPESSFYTIEFGKKSLSVSLADLKQKSWKLDLSIE